MAVNLSEDLVKAGSENLLNLVVEQYKRLKKFIGDEVKIRHATDKYAFSYLDRYGIVQVLGMANPVQLSTLYTDVEISQNDRYRATSIATMDEAFRKTRQRTLPKELRKYGIELANSKQKLNVLGPPGSGKSTFLKNIGLECLTKYAYPGKEQYQHKCFPVLIELKRFRTEHIDIKTLIQRELEIAGFPKSDTLLERLLVNGDLLLLLDGLDEVPEGNLNFALENINDFANQYKENRFVTSCRTAHYKNYLKGFTDIEISEFSNEQLTQFVNNWFSTNIDQEEMTASRLLHQLFFDSNKSTLELARTPLLLAFICMTFDDSQRFPTNRASLYREALMILMKKWAAEKRIHHEEIYQKFTIELETSMLAEIATIYFKEDQIFFHEDNLLNKIRNYLEERGLSESIDINKVIEAIEKQQGLLIQRINTIYSFSHLTIQEYLTALFFSTAQQTSLLIEDHLFEKRWREVFLLRANLGDANDFLLIINDFLIKYAKKEKLISEIVTWLYSVDLNENDIKTAAVNRVFLASVLLRFKRYRPDFVQNKERLENYANELISLLDSPYFDFFILKLPNNFTKQAASLLAKEFSILFPKSDFTLATEKIKSVFPEKKLSEMMPGGRIRYYREMLEILYDTAGIPTKLYTQRQPAYQPLIKYFGAYILLFECVEQSETVKQSTRTIIYQSLLKC